MNIIHCIYSRGDFLAQSVLTTTECLQGYTFALVPMGLILIFAPAFYAKKNYLIPARGAMIALIANTLFDAILVFCFGMKALSIALATSIASLMNAWYLFSRLQKEWGSILSKEGCLNLLKTTLSSLGAGLITFLFLGTIQGYPILFGLFSQNVANLPESFYERISTLLASSLVFASSLFLLAKLLKAKDLLSIVYLTRGDRRE